jgi:hypothetical protein
LRDADSPEPTAKWTRHPCRRLPGSEPGARTPRASASLSRHRMNAWPSLSTSRERSNGASSETIRQPRRLRATPIPDLTRGLRRTARASSRQRLRGSRAGQPRMDSKTRSSPRGACRTRLTLPEADKDLAAMLKEHRQGTESVGGQRGKTSSSSRQSREGQTARLAGAGPGRTGTTRQRTHKGRALPAARTRSIHSSRAPLSELR